MNTAWICTDDSTNQWGRRVSETVWEFKEDVKIPLQQTITVQFEIDLTEYTVEKVENCINTYGYTLHPLSDGKSRCIYNESTDVKFLIAEMLFEYELLENL